MYQTGFNTASYFSKCFKKQFGVIPSNYLKNRKAEVEQVGGERKMLFPYMQEIVDQYRN